MTSHLLLIRCRCRYLAITQFFHLLILQSEPDYFFLDTQLFNDYFLGLDFLGLDGYMYSYPPPPPVTE